MEYGLVATNLGEVQRISTNLSTHDQGKKYLLLKMLNNLLCKENFDEIANSDSDCEDEDYIESTSYKTLDKNSLLPRSFKEFLDRDGYGIISNLEFTTQVNESIRMNFLKRFEY